MTLRRKIIIGTVIATMAIPTVVFADSVSTESVKDIFSCRGYNQVELTKDMETVRHLRQQLRNGELSEVEYEASIAELDFPEIDGMKRKDSKQGGMGGRVDFEATLEYLGGNLSKAEYEAALLELSLPDDFDFDLHLQMIELREQVKDGDLTKEEFAEKIGELGLKEFEMKGSKGYNTLREITRQYLDGDISETEYEAFLEEVVLPEDFDLDTHLEIADLREQLKDGDLTQEEFEEKLEALGVETRGFGQKGKGMKGDFEVFEDMKTIREYMQQLRDGEISQEKFDDLTANLQMHEKPIGGKGSQGGFGRRK